MHHKMGSAETPLGQLDQAVFFGRVAEELKILVESSTDLQAALNQLPLAASNQETRSALQSVDRITQSLACLEIAITQVAGQVASIELDMSSTLEGVFLEDVRSRLAEGRFHKSQNHPAGELDLF